MHQMHIIICILFDIFLFLRVILNTCETFWNDHKFGSNSDRIYYKSLLSEVAIESGS